MYYNSQYSVLYTFQYNVHEFGMYFFLGEESSFANHFGVCVEYIKQYSVQYSIQHSVLYDMQCSLQSSIYTIV